ncbi:MAG TPA: serine protease [Candidatus Baltobacteraceae bacterium]|nr:serine protease [Candidatus Baltobacteraceae bacterium]
MARLRHVDFSLVVLALMLAFCIAGVVDLVRTYPEANRGMLLFARAQKDMFIDYGLVAQSYHVRANVDLSRVLRSETVIVGTRTSPHTVYLGAGVILGEHHGMLMVVTAKHIIAHPGRHFVVFGNYTGRFTSRVVADPNHDLAIVFVRPRPGTTYRPARIAQVSFRSGQRFIVMGHPGDQSWTASPGVAERHMDTTLLFCPTCDRGDSGAGAFDNSGNLRGIVVTKAVMFVPSAKDGTDFRLTAFEIERPDAVRALVRRAVMN